MLCKAGITIDVLLTDNELRYLLWRSYQNQKESAAFDEVRDSEMQQQLGFVDGTSRVDEALAVAEETAEVGPFGNVYKQFKGNPKAAAVHLKRENGGDAISVFSRDGFGEIDLVWGDNRGGLSHIIQKHIGPNKSFSNVRQAMQVIDNIIKNGNDVFENGDKAVFKIGSQWVTVRKNVRNNGKKIADKNWVLTAYDELSADTASAINGFIEGQTAQTTVNNGDKSTEKDSIVQENSEKILFRTVNSEYADKVDDLNKGIEEKGQRGHLGEVPYKMMMRKVYEGNEEMWQDMRQSLADAVDFFPTIKDTKYAMWLNKNRDNDPSDPNDGIKRNALLLFEYLCM